MTGTHNCHCVHHYPIISLHLFIVHLFEFQQILSWEDGSMMTFQQFTSKSFSKNPYYTWSPCKLSELQKKFSTDNFHPHFSTETNCTAMLLFNLAAPEWINIMCSDSLLSEQFCQIENTTGKKIEDWNQNTSCSCLATQQKHHRKCLSIRWQSIVEVNLSSNNLRRYLPLSVNQLNFITNSFKLLPIYSEWMGSKFVFLFDHFRGDYKMEHLNMSNISMGYVVYSTFPANHKIGSHIFACVDGVLISATSVWDGDANCMDASDESFCSYDHSLANSKTKDKILQSHSNFLSINEMNFINMTVCILLLKLSHTYSPERQVQNIQNISQNDRNNPVYDDLFRDCENECEDEPLMQSLLLNNTPHMCRNPEQIPCRTGHPKCYDIHKLCSYKVNNLGFLTPCRNGGHLQNCSVFECNAMYKCPHYYCIPWEYVCDSKWDCPRGLDEQSVCGTEHCTSMFKCVGENHICLHLASVCNDELNCPLGDDEQLCQMSHVACPPQCTCMMFTLVCAKNNFAYLRTFNLKSFHRIVVHNCTLSNIHVIEMDQATLCILANLNVALISCGLVSGVSLIILKL